MALNGESKELLHELDKRLSVLEGKRGEWIKAHDSNAESRYNNMQDNFREIFTKLDSLSCGAHFEIMQALKGKINWLWGISITMWTITIGAIIRHFTVQ